MSSDMFMMLPNFLELDDAKILPASDNCKIFARLAMISAKMGCNGIHFQRFVRGHRTTTA